MCLSCRCSAGAKAAVSPTMRFGADQTCDLAMSRGGRHARPPVSPLTPNLPLFFSRPPFLLFRARSLCNIINGLSQLRRRAVPISDPAADDEEVEAITADAPAPDAVPTADSPPPIVEPAVLFERPPTHPKSQFPLSPGFGRGRADGRGGQQPLTGTRRRRRSAAAPAG